MTRLWLRLVAFGFRLLYNELAWLYDAVSWLASFGLWRRWQQTALGFLPPPGARVLELGVGPGHLLKEMVSRGYRVAALDLSPTMVRRAGRRLRELRPPGPPALVCRGRADALPFAAASFDVAVAAFPTAYIAEPACLSSVARVLRPGGRLVVVEGAILGERGIAGRVLEWLYRVTGQHDPDEPSLAARFEAAGFHARREIVAVEGTVVRLIVAEAPAV